MSSVVKWFRSSGVELSTFKRLNSEEDKDESETLQDDESNSTPKFYHSLGVPSGRTSGNVALFIVIVLCAIVNLIYMNITHNMVMHLSMFCPTTMNMGSGGG